MFVLFSKYGLLACLSFSLVDETCVATFHVNNSVPTCTPGLGSPPWAYLEGAPLAIEINTDKNLDNVGICGGADDSLKVASEWVLIYPGRHLTRAAGSRASGGIGITITDVAGRLLGKLESWILCVVAILWWSFCL
jgi:hypothetical protein